MPERKPLLDPNHPMFAKAWVRWVTAGLPVAWSVVEFTSGSPMWGMLFLGTGAYAAKVLIWDKAERP